MFKIASCILVAVCISFPEDVATASLPNSVRPVEWFDSLRSNFVDNLKGNFKDTIKEMQKEAHERQEEVRNKMSEMYNEMLKRATKIQDEVSDKASNVRDGLLKMQETLLNLKNKYSKEYIQDKFSERFRPIIEHAIEVLQNVGNGLSEIDEKFYTEFYNFIQKLHEKTKRFLEEAENTDIPCDKLKYKGQAFFTEIASKSATCVYDETQAARQNIKDLISLINEVRENILKRVRNLSQKLEEKSYDDVFEGVQNLTKVFPLIQQVFSASVQLSTMLENIKFCVAKSVTSIVAENFAHFVQDGGQCLRDRIEYIH